MKNSVAVRAVAVVSVLSFMLPANANTGLLLEDLNDFGLNAEYSQGSDGHVILECWREPWGDGGEAVIAEWRLRAYHSSLLYVNGTVDFSNSSIPYPLNGSPIGFSVPFSRVASGSEEFYLDEPSDDSVVLASISGSVEVGIESGVILPTTVECPKRSVL